MFYRATDGNSHVDEATHCILIRLLVYSASIFGFLAYMFRPEWFKRYKKIGYVQDIRLYPVVSCVGTSMKEGICGRGGLEKGGYRDREFVIVDTHDPLKKLDGEQFYSERLSTIKPMCEGKYLLLSGPGMKNIRLPVISTNFVKFNMNDSRLSLLEEMQHTYLTGCGMIEEGLDCGKDVMKWLGNYFHGRAGLRLFRRVDVMLWRANREFGARDVTSFEHEVEETFRDIHLSRESSDEDGIEESTSSTLTAKQSKRRSTFQSLKNAYDVSKKGVKTKLTKIVKNRRVQTIPDVGNGNSCVRLRRGSCGAMRRMGPVRKVGGGGYHRPHAEGRIGCRSSGRRKRNGELGRSGIGGSRRFRRVCKGNKNVNHNLESVDEKNDDNDNDKDTSGDERGINSSSFSDGGPSGVFRITATDSDSCHLSSNCLDIHNDATSGDDFSDNPFGNLEVNGAIKHLNINSNKGPTISSSNSGDSNSKAIISEKNRFFMAGSAFDISGYSEVSDENDEDDNDNNDDGGDSDIDYRSNDDEEYTGNNDNSTNDTSSDADRPPSPAKTLKLGIITVHTTATMERVSTMLDAQPELKPSHFRPNIIISGCDEFEELSWDKLRIGKEVVLNVEGPDRRCVQPTVNQDTGACRSEIEPLPRLFDSWCLSGAAPAPIAGIRTSVIREGKVKIGDPVYALAAEQTYVC